MKKIKNKFAKFSQNNPFHAKVSSSNNAKNVLIMMNRMHRSELIFQKLNFLKIQKLNVLKILKKGKDN